MVNQRMAVRLNLPTLLSALALAGAAGCDNDAERDLEQQAQIECGDVLDAGTDGGASTVDAGAQPDAGGPVGIDAGLSEPRILEVSASGSGCPAGSYTAAVAPDGRSVTVVLNAFELEVSSESSVSIKDCQLGLEITEQPGRQYQLSRASVRGVIALDQGVSARVQVNSYFQGNPAQGELWQTDLAGPQNDDLVLDTPEATTQWSPCGLDRDVNVRFTGRLTNLDAPERNGYVKVDQVQVFNLKSRACE